VGRFRVFFSIVVKFPTVFPTHYWFLYSPKPLHGPWETLKTLTPPKINMGLPRELKRGLGVRFDRLRSASEQKTDMGIEPRGILRAGPPLFTNSIKFNNYLILLTICRINNITKITEKGQNKNNWIPRHASFHEQPQSLSSFLKSRSPELE
jgi:hypothetical protein